MAEFSIVAHSNGTYMLGQSLLHTPGMRFITVVLAGSVLPQTFPWDQLAEHDQVIRVRNERANRDWPVAVLCSGLRGLQMRDVGTAGFAGFEGAVVQESLTTWAGMAERFAPIIWTGSLLSLSMERCRDLRESSAIPGI
jgi:hypothetical protein